MDTTTWKMTPAKIGLLVALVVVCQVVPAVIAAQANKTIKRTSNQLPSAPPPVAFSVVWPLLYLLIAGSLWFLCATPSSAPPGVRWTAVALLAAQLPLNWAWLPVFSADKRRAATRMIVAMLMLTLPGIVLAARTSTIGGALWAPYAAWLVFALVLSSEANAKARAQASTQP